MKVKCKLCGLKGYWDFDRSVSEFHASRFLWIHMSFSIGGKSYFVCRKCVRKVLDAVVFEQDMIDRLYEPEVKEPQPKKVTKKKRGKK